MFKAIIQSMAILREAGFCTYGNWSDAEFERKADVYTAVVESDSRITPDIVKATTQRYIMGQVTTIKEQAEVPVARIFPTAPDYLNACRQTFRLHFQEISIGETMRNGYLVTHTILVPRNIATDELSALLMVERARLTAPEKVKNETA